MKALIFIAGGFEGLLVAFAMFSDDYAQSAYYMACACYFALLAVSMRQINSGQSLFKTGDVA